MHPVRIAIDWDGTLWRCVDLWAALQNDPRFSYDNCATWDHPINWAGGLEAFKELLVLSHSPAVMAQGRNHYTFEGSIETHLELQAAGAVVALLTARLEEEIVSVLDVLSYHGVVPDLVASREPEAKVSYCLEHQFNLLIEDNPDTVRMAHAAGLAVTGLRHPYVAGVFDELGLASANTWHQLKPIIYRLTGLVPPSPLV
jgi:hypothetical protein